ncbi:L-arabinose isomerase [Paucilactobacillus vaccinostercus DSM 20634]|uniref:L-arabinose isomerase n=1 Tax=Paucilactobacillus vaccinostercus DSM 20634 TaxID=1423813 RepID=A0A0R2A3V5_9LACO|nr:L-arabinose isomerase [Paucilactobacillus vaccinostercus]KRM61693.1 L-arabinose isomerase [Paucilactobacillus vaccinostercus DSM 20634]RRG10708.1 MAG: L-arabinose isomerase [Lactobacillus sp.]
MSLQVPDYEFWFATGSQFLYGEEQLKSVENDAREIVDKLNASGKLPYKVVFKLVATTAENITQFMKDANYNDNVAGVITWMHTFSPAKNWIRGTKLLQKPLLHLATQFLNKIPYDTIDFDYMNLNQSAHGDREYGYINARLGVKNKIVYGWWGDEETQEEIGKWEDVAVAYNESQKIRIVRFGDNMRNVAVTEGDKVSAQIKFGWTVDYYGVGDLVEEIKHVSEDDVNAKYEDLQKDYEFVVGDNTPEKFESSVKEQLRQYFALKSFMDKNNYQGFVTNFEDLWGLKQLPGLAAQLLMAEGYGFGAEGDWKTAALGRLMKIMSHNDKTIFMEDYTLELRKGKEAILGSHMLEVDPSIASDKPRVEVHPLDIGGKDDPARLVFAGSDGEGIDVTLTDMGDDFRLISYEVNAAKTPEATPYLPVAQQLWTPKMGLKHGATEWIRLGGGHHTVLSLSLTTEQIQEFADMIDLNFVDIK